MSKYATRRDRLRRRMKKSQLTSMLVTNEVNVTYLTGFTGDSSFLLLHPTGAIVISDSRYSEQLEEECSDLDHDIRQSSQRIVAAVSRLTRRLKISALGVESGSMTMAMHRQLAAAVGTTELVATEGQVEQLREIKDASEISTIRRAVRIAERAFAATRAMMRDGQSEREIAFELENQVRMLGARGCSFDPIVAVGPRAALPHATPGERQIGESDFVLIDWGADFDMYRSDLTRILVTGKISPKLQRIYTVVLRAQLRAIKAIRPGALMKDVDAAARGVIEKAGFGKKFGHSLGHGIGLDIHEEPRLASGQDRPLKPGMVVTVEPGIYLPGWGGVRIEDDILVTRDGHEVLSTVSKQLDDCQVQ